MGIELCVGLRYCGGCNPRYDRVALVRELEQEFQGIRFLPSEDHTWYPVELAVCGCAVQCAAPKRLEAGQRTIAICSPEDLPRVRAALTVRIRDITQNKEVSKPR